ncbi:MBL fold metallo-hydrolase [Cytobacillus sp. FSL R7-0680]|uniref:MBL fold metallo-hydrolase n=1 Tax=Cytobacillus sp. FSL R7-0680 TaxID=2921689 RepID=UPI0030F99F3F
MTIHNWRKSLLLIVIILFTVTLTACATETTTEEQTTFSPTLTAHFIDVDQGEATLLQGEDFTILIDSGRHDGDEVVPYLQSVGVKEIDLLVGSHPHADHIGQMPEVINSFPVKEVWMSGAESTSRVYEDALDAIIESEAAYHIPRAGESFTIGSAQIDILHPSSVDEDLNNSSIGMKITYKEQSFLFTGDAETSAENEMLASGNIEADIFKIAHHGSDTSNSEAFIEAIHPEIAIYSAGADNSYGHPNQEVLNRLQQMNIDVYGTIENGTVIIQSDGHDYLSINGVKEKEDNKTNVEVVIESCPADHIMINEANAETLQQIHEIGPDRAEEIIEKRPFTSYDDLQRIAGIGPAKAKEIEDQSIICF